MTLWECIKLRKYPYPEYPSIQQAMEKWRKWGEMGENEGKWGKGGKWEIATSKLWKMYDNIQEESKMEENRVEMGGKWVKMGDGQATSAFFQVPFSHFSERSPISLQGR